MYENNNFNTSQQLYFSKHEINTSDINTGLHPSLGEGIVNRTACGLGIAENETCFSQYNIMVKNCSTFYVYFLPKTHRCNEGYCFGIQHTYSYL